MSEFNELFETATSVATGNSGRQLAGTAQLTSTATMLADQVLEAIKNGSDETKDLVVASKTDSKAMKQLVGNYLVLDDSHVEFMQDMTDEDLEGMLFSQMSKRSRTKAKEMTFENYKTMMIAEIAELMIRKVRVQTAADRPKRESSLALFTPERLAEMALDQYDIRRQLRNVQSKKSIFKKTDDYAEYGEDCERWKLLTAIEQQLFSIRTDMTSGSSVQVIKVDATKSYLQELLAEVDVDSLKLKEAKEILQNIKTTVYKDDENDEEPADDTEGNNPVDPPAYDEI